MAVVKWHEVSPKTWAAHRDYCEIRETMRCKNHPTRKARKRWGRETVRKTVGAAWLTEEED